MSWKEQLELAWEKYTIEIEIQFREKYNKIKGIKKIFQPKEPNFTTRDKLVYKSGFMDGYIIAQEKYLKEIKKLR